MTMVSDKGAVWRTTAGAGVMCFLCACLLIGCDKPAPIRIGFSGCLTGRLSDLGMSGRNGLMLAVEDRNAAGGIGGRPVTILIRDDQHNADTARAVDQGLIDAGVPVIVGHMTRSMTQAVMPIINRVQVILLSPTTSTHELTGLDDGFIRVIDQSTAESDHLAAYAANRLGCKAIVAIVEGSNAAYTHAYFDNFTKAFARCGGRMHDPVPFLTGQVAHYHELVGQALKDSPDAVLIVSAALDGAMLCQQIRKLDPRVPILMAGWAHTPEFIEHGGDAVEGVMFSHIVDPTGQQPRYVAFQDKYVKRFSRQPDFAATLSYEAGQLLLDALATTTDPIALKAALLKKHTIAGLQGDFAMDRFGDVRRKRFYITIHDHRYQTVGQ